MGLKAAIYVRISRDDGTELGVKRQEQDCRAFCDSRGWDVAEVIKDNDVSAYSRKPRPGYERLMEGIKEGEFDALVVWHPDRLHRSPAELEQFIDLVEATRVQVETVTTGSVDLATSEGRFMARIVGSVARKESEDKSRRLKRKHQELAEAGKISGGGLRPFGYEADRKTIRPAEADDIRWAAAAALAGESLRSIAMGLNRRGVPTVTGADWSPTTVKRLLMSGRIAGQREHRGVLASRAEWPAIIEIDDSLRLRAMLGGTKSSTRSGVTARTNLLTGFLFCGGCGNRMSSGAVKRKEHRYPRYVCRTDRGGCGRVGIAASGLDADIASAVLRVLDTPKLARAIDKERRRRAESMSTVEQVMELEARLDDLAEMYAAGEIGRKQLAIATDGIEQRLTVARQAVASESVAMAGEAYLGRGAELEQSWETLTLDQRRAVVGAVVSQISIAPTERSDNRYNLDRVDIQWRY
jgi:DNA invertase Pin-like site-specific DNA recombinase